ncbi:MAG: flippase-like domain-containing protein [Candidatus Omnitrophica bacterium]|nr:flippase-like domain-containing protein [Candidatus Omnitrophota bacterium]
MYKKAGSQVLRIAISVFSLALVFYTVRGEVREGLSRLTHLESGPLFLAMAVNFLSLVVVTYRLDLVLAIQKIKLSFKRLYYLWMISLFFNLFLPSAVGGDIAKTYYIYKDSGKKIASVTSVIIDRFFGLMATVSIGFIAFLIGHHYVLDPRIGQSLFWISGFVFLGVMFVVSRRFSTSARNILFKFSPRRFHERLTRLFETLGLYRERRRIFLLVYGYSLVAQGLFIVMVFFLGRSIQVDVPLGIFFLFMPLITVVSMLPSIGGLGVREAATVYLFRSYVPLDQAVAFSLIFDLFLYAVGFVCGILYAVRGGASIRELETIEP